MVSITSSNDSDRVALVERLKGMVERSKKDNPLI